MSTGTHRDFAGYGGHYPSFSWPGGAGLAMSFVLNVEEGAELSVTTGDARSEGRHEVSNEIVRVGEQPHRLLPYAFDTIDMKSFDSFGFVRGNDFADDAIDAFEWLLRESRHSIAAVPSERA